MRSYRFQFVVECMNDQGTADLARVEEMIDLSMQELVHDDDFIAALGEDTAVTIQVTPQFGNTDG